MLLKFYKNINETGTDEAGRGCLAGPVTAAAIILPETFENSILTDSKLLSEHKRQLLEPLLKEDCICFGIAHIQPEIIDDINILMDTLNDFVKTGKIISIGLSNETCWGTLQFLKASKKYKSLNIASIQNEYSLLCRLYDQDMNELSHYENVPLLAYSPLAGGILTGKYLNNAVPTNSRLSRIPKVFGRLNERSNSAVQEYVNLSKANNIHPVHLALSFCKQKSFMGSVIFGATTNDQLDKILEGVDITLTKEIISEINVINKKFPMTF